MASNAKKSVTKKPESTNNLHVVPKQQGWAVKVAGSSRAARVYDTQAEAIEAAKKAAKGRAEVILHGRDGRARHSISMSPADEAMMRVWKSIHAEDSENESDMRKAG